MGNFHFQPKRNSSSLSEQEKERLGEDVLAGKAAILHSLRANPISCSFLGEPSLVGYSPYLVSSLRGLELPARKVFDRLLKQQ
jgi:hypothetical protein